MEPTQLDRIEAMLRQLIAGERPTFDPTVKWLPKEADQQYKGVLFSCCPSALLFQLAKSYEHFAEKSATEGATLSNGKPKADWDRKLADAARRWAKWNSINEPEEKPNEESPF